MRVSSKWRAKSVVPFGVRSVTRHDETQIHVQIDTRITGEAMHTREKTYCVDCGLYIDPVPREFYNTLEAARSASPNRDEEIADRVLKDTTITKRQLDLATRLTLEDRFRSENVDNLKLELDSWSWGNLNVEQQVQVNISQDNS